MPAENGGEMDGAFKFLLTEDQGRVRIITINRPAELNALDSEVLSELDRAFAEAGAAENIDAVILTGTGKSFVAGADIAQMAGFDAEAGRAFGAFGAEVFRRIETLGKVVIAAVNGYALGGGCELAMACDIRIASEKAKIGQPETGLGIIPGFSGTQRLPRIVGVGKAKELIYTAEAIDAQEAFRIGLFNKVVEPDRLLPEALAMAGKIISRSRRAVRYAKEAVNRGIETDMETGMRIESGLFGLCFAGKDQKEGMRAFLERRKAEFEDK